MYSAVVPLKCISNTQRWGNTATHSGRFKGGLWGLQLCLTFKRGISRSLQEKSLDIGRALNSVISVQSLLEDYRANVEQLNHQRFESARICEPLDIELEAKKNLEYVGDK